MNFSTVRNTTAILVLASLAMSAQATRLELNPSAHVALHWGANFILYTHIIGGALGLLTGLIASLAKKGGTLHKRAGKVFMVSMFVCYFIGAMVAPFLSDGQRPNFVAAVLALYLLVSGIHAAKRKIYTASIYNALGLVVALGISAMGFLFMYMGSQSEAGSVDGSPPEAFVIFAIVGLLAFIGEARVLIIRKLSQEARLIRHLWRMCFSFFFASGSLFFGQPQIFPQWFNASLLPEVLAIFPILILVYGVLSVSLKGLLKRLNFSQRTLSKNFTDTY
ncbi:hypothetical protein QWI17_15220 [Gilvimarinus sp. SDUM040013]|uniref:DUF2306 domain-containing protein n=1 Tax=Gilvimarinus gilvus TaxID=3058038 RepID=A0ABU4S0S2_9GAMM|nr:hypothetical protein [Gilvimarinus sp. SDUM040013]MDO3387192.1 hypothetical protein [Gilvimarinus sp. SDUM040013]MDX6850755.1 hypothetical protein [Gilvimarinus sp. SDUM040013]